MSSPDHSPNSTPPSTPTSHDTPQTPSDFRPTFPYPMSDTSSNFPNDTSHTSTIPTDMSNTSSIPHSDTSGTSSIPQGDTSRTSSLPSEITPSLVPRPTDISLTHSSDSTQLRSHTPSLCSPNTETDFLRQLAPRQPKIDIHSGNEPEQLRNPLIRELIDVGVTYIRFSELKIVGDLGSVSLRALCTHTYTYCILCMHE